MFRYTVVALCGVLAWTEATVASLSPGVGNATIEIHALRGVRNASIEFERLRGVRSASIEFAPVRGIRHATIEFDLFAEGRQIEVIPEALGYGGVPVGSSATQIVTITNIGFADLTVSALNLSPTPPFSLVDPPSVPFVLSQGQSEAVTVEFAPSDPGPASGGTLEVVSDDEDTPSVIVPLSGEGAPLYCADIEVHAAKHTVGSGSHPGSTKEPLVGIQVCAYDKSEGACSRVECGGISHQHYTCIAEGDEAGGACDPVNCCVTDENGECTINLPPGDYIVISADATKTVLPDPLGVSASDLVCEELKQKHLQQISKVQEDGAVKKRPGKTTRLTGSELLIIEPEYVLWDDTEQLYPFVFETIGDWGVSVSVEPPEGFVTDYESLSEDVDDEIEAVQFTITEVGSDLVPTETTFQVTHNGQSHVVHSRVGIMLTPNYAQSRGFNVAALRAQGLIKERPGNQGQGHGKPHGQ